MSASLLKGRHGGKMHTTKACSEDGSKLDEIKHRIFHVITTTDGSGQWSGIWHWVNMMSCMWRVSCPIEMTSTQAKFMNAIKPLPVGNRSNEDQHL